MKDSMNPKDVDMTIESFVGKIAKQLIDKAQENLGKLTVEERDRLAELPHNGIGSGASLAIVMIMSAMDLVNEQMGSQTLTAKIEEAKELLKGR